MKIAAISFTERGHALGRRLAELLPEHELALFAGLGPRGSLAELVAEVWGGFDALVFICAAGIAVRGIAPLIEKKDRDPAVLVADEAGRFVIPLLSGHIGGANRLAARLADALGAAAVITTATDINGVFAADTWAAEHNCAIADTREIKHISAALLRGESVSFRSDFPVTGELPQGLTERGDAECGIVISTRRERRDFPHTLHLIPRTAHLGAGCRRGAAAQSVIALARAALEDADIHSAAVAAVASVDLKSDEPAISELARAFSAPLAFYSAAELAAAEGEFSESDFVKSTVGVGNVCERAAVLSSGGELQVKKTAGNGATVAVAVCDWEAVF
ncbi:MAG: cobalt-precorrin 5A hydrolase [Oscillospiraceae bacterium]|jgi:cobalt-precorrin 5A hydrolase|nr:cobalt-precorrin 5A hydrolase [Oscillospiraceae bacterium]